MGDQDLVVLDRIDAAQRQVPEDAAAVLGGEAQRRLHHRDQQGSVRDIQPRADARQAQPGAPERTHERGAAAPGR